MAGVRARHLERLELWLDRQQKSALMQRALAEGVTAQAIVRRAVARELAETGARSSAEEQGGNDRG